MTSGNVDEDKGSTGDQPAPKKGMASAFALLGAACIVGIVLQHVLISTLLMGDRQHRVFSIVVGLFAFTLVVAAGWSRKWQRFFTSNRFAVPAVICLTAFAIVGTVVLQNESEQTLNNAYGHFALSLIQGLFLDDIFHSFGFYALVGLGAGGIALTVTRQRKLTVRNAGSTAAHLGLLLVLAGAVIGNIWGIKGRLNMHTGESSDLFFVPAADGRVLEVPLGFTVRLDDFKLKHYKPEYRLMVFEVTGKEEKKLASVDPESPGVGDLGSFGVEILDYQPGKAAAEGSFQHVITTAGRKIPVEVGKTYPLPGTEHRMQVRRFLVDFVKTNKPQNRSSKPNNPAIELAIIDADGKVLGQRWLFAKFPDFHGQGKDSPLAGFEYDYSDGAKGPVVSVRVPGKAEPINLDSKRPLWLDDEKKKVLVLAPKGGDAVRDYLSTLSVIEDGRKVLTKVVEVNYPLVFRGFAFFQSDYRPEDPTFSGFQVVRDPGVWIVYTGFFLNAAGVFCAIFLPPVLRRRRAKKAAAGGGS